MMDDIVVNPQKDDMPVPPPVTRSAKLDHDSGFGEVFGMWLVNLLLSILTLGIYSFWGRTRMRRLIWGRTGLLGDQFEYHGRGIELFLGFIVASVLFFGPTTAINFMVVQMEDPFMAAFLQFVPALIMVILLPTAFFTARRYLLTRTSWRGVRGDQPTGFWDFIWRAILGYFLIIFTLGFAFPWVAARVMSRLNRYSRFGGQNFGSNMAAWPLFKAYLLYFVGFLSIFGALFYFVLFPDIQALQEAQQNGTNPQALGQSLVASAIITYLLVLLAMPVMYSWMQLTWWRQYFGTLSLNGTTATFDANLGQVLWYLVKAVLIALFTLGLGQAFIMRMKIRFLAKHLEFHNIQHVEDLVAENVTALHTGEGLADALFDGIGIGF